MPDPIWDEDRQRWIHPSPPDPDDIRRWCDKHQKYECKIAVTYNDGWCHKTPGQYMATCDSHSGLPRAAYEARKKARRAFAKGELDLRHVHPGEVVLKQLWRAQLVANYLEEALGKQVDDTWDPEATRSAFAAKGDTGGLVGYTFGPTGKPTGEAPRALVSLYVNACDRVVKYAKVAHDMGIAERDIRLAETQAGMMMSVFQSTLNELTLSPEQQALVPDALTKVMRRMELISGEVV